MAIRSIPNDLEAEKCVIGSMFLSKYALDKACDVLTKDHFYLESNGKIFNTLKEMAEKKLPIDLTTVTSELKDRELLNQVGGVEGLTEVLDSVASGANIDYYIKKVQDKYTLRKIIEVATNISTNAYDSTLEVDSVLDDAEAKMLGIGKNRRTSEFKTIQDVVLKTQENLEILAKNKGDITGIPTGWVDIDKITTGLQPNEFIIIAARPAMGKTAFALNLATNVAINTDKTVALFNMEMGAEQLANRIISSLGQIEGVKLSTGRLLNDDWKRVNEAVSQLSDAKMYMDDTPGITIGEIKSKCRRLANSEEGLGLVIIDYLQLISSTVNYGSNRQQEVSDISRALKMMAMELNVPVVALAQLSRAVDAREDKRPIMSDLRESGSIEQDADIVAFLYRDDYYHPDKKIDENNSISEFIIRKHRKGPTGTIELLFKRNTSTFVSYKKEEVKSSE